MIVDVVWCFVKRSKSGNPRRARRFTKEGKAESGRGDSRFGTGVYYLVIAGYPLSPRSVGIIDLAEKPEKI